jgi:hypothetical protein
VKRVIAGRAELGGNEQKNKDGDGADEKEEDPFKMLMEK